MQAVKRRCAICHTSYTRGESFCPRDGGAVVADDGTSTIDDLVGTTIDGRYLVTRVLGRGGMGKVYEADHVGLGKRVAIKLVSDADADRDQRARFRQEARAASGIAHENVIQIFDVGVDASGRDYIVMEYVGGRDLDDLIREGPLPTARAVAITQQILRGLHACHAAGIVHRDIKPSNIRLTNDRDFVKIMDFGISKSVHAHVAQTDTGTGKVIGTPQFMAPEQLLDEPVDRRADIYAVGATLFAMLAGKPPFASASFTQRIEALTAPPPAIAELRGGLAPSLVAAITRSLARSPDDRFPDALAFANALGEVAVVDAARAEAPTKPASIHPMLAPTVAATPAASPRARRIWPLVLGFVLLAGAAGAVTIALTRDTAKPAAAPLVDAAVIDAPILALSPDDAPSPDPSTIVDAAAIVDTPPRDAAPARVKPRTTELPAGTVVPTEPKGKPCACEFRTSEGSIDRACAAVMKQPRCSCNESASQSLCPYVITVVDNGVRKPDGSSAGHMMCVDRTRADCDATSKAMPDSCRVMYRVAIEGAACSGYKSGQVEGDPKRAGRYHCTLCDWSTTAPKFYGNAGDVCIGFSRHGEKVQGTLRCWN